MVDLFTIAFVGTPLILFLLKKPLGLVSRITSYFDGFYVLQRGKFSLSLYKIFSYFALVGLWAFMLEYLPQVFSENNNPAIANYLNGHWLSWIAMVIVITRYGYFDIIKGAYAAAFIYSIHESMWVISDAIAYSQYAEGIFLHYIPLLLVMGFLLIGYFFAWRGLPRGKEALIIAIVITWDVLWLLAGFHTSVNNYFPNPKTPFYTDPLVNIIEILGWVIPTVVAVI